MSCHMQLCSSKFEQKYLDIMLVYIARADHDFVIMKVYFNWCRTNTVAQLWFRP